MTALYCISMTPEQMKAGSRKLFVAVQVATLALIAAIWADRFLPNAIETVTGVRLQRGGSAVYAHLVVLAIELALYFAAMVYMQRQFLPKCPNCRKTLGKMDQGIAVATKHCPHCGAQIIAGTPA